MHTRLLNFVMIVLLALATLELVYSLVAKKGAHTFRDTVSSISLGVGQQALNVFVAATFLSMYAAVHATVAIGHGDPAVWWHWVLLIFACDFCYYVGHRAAHNVNLFVAGHIVHHQAEDFNLLSSLRQSWTAWMLMGPFFLPLAVVGVPLEMFVKGQVGIMLFQFLSHTGVTRIRLGILDRLLITPKNHRIHHGDRAPYWGANCGGMFVIWDRILGTYVEEDPNVPLLAGSGIELNFHDPFQANLEYYRRIWFVSARRRGIWQRFRIWFQTQQTLADELERLGYVELRPAQAVNRAPLERKEKVAIGLVLVGVIGVFAAHRALFEGRPLLVNLATGALVFAGLWLLGALLSGSFKGAPTPAASATSAPGTHSGSRTSPTPRAHTSVAGKRTPERPIPPPREAALGGPERDGRRTPYRARSESPLPVSGRSTSSPPDGYES
jgi:sterol desaturase/sphingolipid hydroxylase (fatty acid hydroxylase superfamily)